MSMWACPDPRPPGLAGHDAELRHLKLEVQGLILCLCSRLEESTVESSASTLSARKRQARILSLESLGVGLPGFRFCCWGFFELSLELKTEVQSPRGLA